MEMSKNSKEFNTPIEMKGNLLTLDDLVSLPDYISDDAVVIQAQIQEYLLFSNIPSHKKSRIIEAANNLLLLLE